MAKNQIQNKIRLAVVGAKGRMGTRIIALAGHDALFQVVAGVERSSGKEFAGFTGDGRAPIVHNIAEVLPKTDVVIDFTAPEAVLKTAAAVAKAKRALVIGTTGLKPAALKKLAKLAKRIPIVFSPNMSVGVNVLFQLIREAAHTLSHYDIEIVEAHHHLKKDAPSGTALKLAEIAAEASGRERKNFVYGRQGLVGARKHKEIGVLSVRAGDIIGDHTVYLGGPGERLELTHRAQSRDAFAAGALQAAAWIVRRKPGLYSMKDVLGL